MSSFRILPVWFGMILIARSALPDGVIGRENFTYADGPIAGKTGGEGFDRDNSTANNAFIGHTGTTADWDNVGGTPQVSGGRLITSNSSAKREFDGPGEGLNTDEYYGAINGDAAANAKAVYFRFSMTRDAAVTWSGLSSYDFGNERILFGVPNVANPASGKREFAIHILGGAEASYNYSGIVPVAGLTYTLVGKLDFANQVLKLWINPDLSQPEASNVPVVTRSYTAGNWSSALRFGSGSDTNGAAIWDDLCAATTWTLLQQADTDGDGIPDDWETANGLNPAVNDAALDPDNDGLDNLDEYHQGTNPQVADTDGDGLDDGDEIQRGTNPLLADSDGDGLSDGVETGTGIYVNAGNTGTNPLTADSDGDGFSDSTEITLGTNPNDTASYPPTGNLALLGYDDFTYTAGNIAGRNGGLYFDTDNSITNNAFIGHDGTSSAWINTVGTPTVASGRLVTNNSSARRPFNGPATGAGTDEEYGAIASGRPCQVLYFRTRMNRTASATFSGISCYSYTAEKLFFGVVSEGAGTDTLGVSETGVGTTQTTAGVADGTDHEIVGKLDTSTGLAVLWLDPDFTKAESANAPAVTRVMSASFVTTSLRLSSGGQATWDNFRVTTTWNALADGAPQAVADQVSLHRGQKVRLQVLSNDSGAYDAQGLSIVSGPSAGAAIVMADHTILYSHNGGAAGTDTLTYRLPSLFPGVPAADATVTITVTEQLRIPSPTLQVPASPPPAAYVMVNAFPGVTFSNPDCIARVANDGKRLFVGERNGKIWLIPDVTAAAPVKQLFLDVAAVVNPRATEDFVDDSNERGLKGLAFHPDYANNGRLFVTYCLTINGVKQVRLSSFNVSAANPAVADTASEKPFITQVHQDTIHNIDDIVFGPDGYLYMSCGDEGPQNDGSNNSQRIDKNFWSSIFRIDVDRKAGSLEPNANTYIAIDGTTGKARYAVPPDNPFIGATSFNRSAVNPSQVRTEIYAMGFRNPWQMNFDPANGDLWVGDVGNNTVEEVDRVIKGGNYQWGYKEGNLAGPKTAPVGFTGIPPVYSYLHGSGPYQGASVTGGLIVRGNRYPGLEGRYLFADYVSGNVWTLQNPTSANPVVERIAGETGIVAFDTDPSNGDILMVDLNDGRILRLAVSSDDSTFPDRLSKTGIFADLADLSPNPGILPYDVNLPFWSDHAKKRRWFSMPTAGSAATFQSEGNWALPTGAVWVKHFDMEMERGNPASAKRIETRLVVKTDTTAYGVSYRWNDAGTEAFLVPDGGVTIPLRITVDGTPQTQPWSIPSRAQCMTCHSPAAGSLLSFRTRQLNHAGTMGSASGNYLNLLHDAGYLDQTPPAGLPRHYALSETEYSLETRARSWLSVNCSYCHQQGGGGLGAFDLSAWLGLFQTGIIDGTVGNSAGNPADRLIVRGDTLHSAILSRMSATNGYTRMPPLASAVVDQEGIAVVRDWILQELPDRKSYDEWSSSAFAGHPADGVPGADPDGDGVTNHDEYLMHTNPALPGPPWRPSLGRNGQQLQLSWPNLPDRSIKVWTSTDLMNWSPWNVPGNDGVPRAGTGTRALPVSGNEEKRFYRFTIGE